MDTIMPWIINSFKDEDIVRQAAFISISEFAKHIPDAIVPYHKALVPILLAGVQDKQDIICMKSCYAVSYYISCLKTEHFNEHMNSLLETIISRLQNQHSDPEVSEHTINALSAVISQAGDRFHPYFNPVIAILKHLMSIQDVNLLHVRARATECVGILAASSSRELFLPHFNVRFFSLLYPPFPFPFRFPFFRFSSILLFLFFYFIFLGECVRMVSFDGLTGVTYLA